MEIRVTDDTDEEGIRSLFKVCFGKELSHEEWLWKYKDSYLGSSSFIAEDSDRIIAHYGGFKMRFYSKGRIFNAYQGCDVMTHPKFRAMFFAKKGIIVRLAEAFYDANPMEFIFGFPSERHARLMRLQLEWEKHMLINVMKKERVSFKPFRSLFLKIEAGWDRISPEDIDSLWNKTRDSRDLSIEKNSRYIFWRYRDNPRGGYEIIGLKGLFNGDLKACAIIRVSNDNLSVLDLFVSTDNDFKKVMGYIEHVALRRGMKTVSLWVNPAEKTCDELKDSGYSEEKGVPYTLKVFKGSGVTPDFFLRQYNYSMGDYDAA